MDKKQNKLDELRGKQPFSVPEGYMENLADQVMSQLPERETAEPVRVSLMERMRPWLYLAAFFAGAVLFFPYLLTMGGTPDKASTVAKVEQTQTETPEEVSAETEDDEYLDFMEERYVDLLLAEELASLND